MVDSPKALITLHFGKKVAWDHSPEFAELFSGFISRFRDPGPPDLVLSVGLRNQEDFFETEGNVCFFSELPAELDFINVLSYWTRRILAPEMSDALVLHASAVRMEPGALLMIGPRGSGKTTLAMALCDEGYGFMAEDGAPVSLDGKFVFPSMPMSFLPDSISGPAGLFQIISLRYAPGSRTRLERISGRDAALELLRENFNLRATGKPGLALVARLSDQGIFALRFPGKKEGLRAIKEIAGIGA
ncbi:MAG: hypothetical protein ACP5QG_00315 [candidate division WOR-3 bacterium]